MGSNTVCESNPLESPATALCFRIRTPSQARMRKFGTKAATLLERPRPKSNLALAIYELTDSPVFSWRASTSICRMLGINNDSGSEIGETERKLIGSAMKLILAALKSSQDDAYRIASEMGNFAGCRKDHLVLFFGILRPAAKASPEAALNAMQCFHKDGNVPYLLNQYALALECAKNKGGLETMGRIAELFSLFSRFSESARMLLESYLFSISSMNIKDVEGFTQQFCEDWKKSLVSDAFSKNPD